MIRIHCAFAIFCQLPFY